ncbi:MAG: transcriptional repressor [Hymenobacter sp.]|nr:transcriptional repressor [Hymenobacter sp.]
MSTDSVLSATLRQHLVRPTRVRRAVLAILGSSPFALSGAEIEKQLLPTTDRITLYRTLRTFEQQGLVHRVVDHSETVRYAACPDPTRAATDHVHFKCRACHRIYCLSHVAVPVVALPGQYRVERGDYLLSGVCERCQPD